MRSEPQERKEAGHGHRADDNPCQPQLPPQTGVKNVTRPLVKVC